MSRARRTHAQIVLTPARLKRQKRTAARSKKTESICVLAYLPPSWSRKYTEIQREMKTLLGSKLKLDKPQNLHITLSFVGKVPILNKDAIVEVVSEVCQKFEPIEFKPRGLGFFPPNDDNQVPIYIDYEETPTIHKFAQALREALSPYLSDDTFVYSRYQPHSTIGSLNRELTDEEKDNLLRHTEALPPWVLSTISITGSDYKPYAECTIGSTEAVTVRASASTKQLRKAAKRYPFLQLISEMLDPSGSVVEQHFRLYQGYAESARALLKQVTAFENGDWTPTPEEWRSVKTGLSHNLNALKLHEIFLLDAHNTGSRETTERPAFEAAFTDHNSVKRFWEDVRLTAQSVRNGWVIICYDPVVGQLFVDCCDLHNLGLTAGGIPVACLDMWEHSYADEYGTDKETYIDHWIEGNNWSNVVDRIRRVKSGDTLGGHDTEATLLNRVQVQMGSPILNVLLNATSSERDPGYPRIIRNLDQDPEIGKRLTRTINLRKVAKRLYIGSMFAVSPELSGRHWDTVIDMAGVSGPESSADSSIRDTYKSFRKVVTLGVDDGEKIPPSYLFKAVRAYQKAHGPVLVHCHMGISRSVSVAYAILRVALGLSHEEAYRRVIDPRRKPHPVTIKSTRDWVEKQSEQQ